MLENISPALLAILIGVGTVPLVVIAVWYVLERRSREAAKHAYLEALAKARAQPLPEGSLELNHDGMPTQVLSSILAGKILLVLDGTFAASLGIRLLKVLDICGLSDALAPILLIELDKGQRAKFLQEAPDVFLDRLIVAECASLSGSGGNRGPGWLNKMREHWVPEIRAKATAVCDLHQRRGLALYGRSDDAAQVLAVISEGTSGWVGLEALPIILGRFIGAQCVGLTAYPVDDLLRGRTAELLQKWQEAGCQRIYVEDNAPDGECPERDLLANDLGMVTLIVAPIAAAASTHDAAAESNNMHTLIFGLDEEGQNPGESGPSNTPGQLRLASFRVFTTSVPGKVFQPHPAIEPRYYVVADSMSSTAINALKEVRKPKYRAITAELGRAKTARFDIIMTALDPNSLRSLEDDIVTAEKTAADPPLQRNRHLLVAGMKTLIDPLKPTCPLVAVSVEALADPKTHLREVASARKPKELPSVKQVELPVAEQAEVFQTDQEVEHATQRTAQDRS